MELILNTPNLDEAKRLVDEAVNKNPQRTVSSVTIEYETARKICRELNRSMSKKNVPDITELLSEKIGYPVDVLHMLKETYSVFVKVFFEPTVAEIFVRKINHALDSGLDIRYVRVSIHEWEELSRLKDRDGITVTRWETVTSLYDGKTYYPRGFEYRGVPIMLEGSHEENVFNERNK